MLTNVPPRKLPFIWTKERQNLLINVIEDNWEALKDGQKKGKETWRNITETVKNELEPEFGNSLSGTSCYSKWASIRKSIAGYTAVMHTSGGAGGSCLKPEFYDRCKEFMKGSVDIDGNNHVIDSGMKNQLAVVSRFNFENDIENVGENLDEKAEEKNSTNEDSIQNVEKNVEINAEKYAKRNIFENEDESEDIIVCEVSAVTPPNKSPYKPTPKKIEEGC